MYISLKTAIIYTDC